LAITLKLSFSSSDLPGLFRALLATGIVGNGPPISLSVDTASCKAGPDWFEKWSAGMKKSLAADWEGAGRLSLYSDRVVLLSVPEYDLDLPRFLDFLSDLPFLVGCAANIYPQWKDGSLGEEYLAPTFGDMHWPLGWACFFKGEGHQRLCSRRWLDFGPWRTLYGPNDTSLVLFHDLRADAATALAQARPAHERMGISPTGGFLQSGYVLRHDFKGQYFPDQRKLRLVVHGREVTQLEMRDACAARLYQLLGPDQPLDNLVYVFVEDEPVAVHLHELWLRGLECHVFRDGVELDLSADYKPAPVKPDWVRLVEDGDR